MNSSATKCLSDSRACGIPTSVGLVTYDVIERNVTRSLSDRAGNSSDWLKTTSREELDMDTR